MKFKTIVLIIFIVFGVVGVAFFAAFDSSDEDASKETVEMWGTLPSEYFGELTRVINEQFPNRLKMIYVEKNETTFEQELVNAIASGVSPDVILFQDEYIVKNSDKIVPVPYVNFPEREFKGAFIEPGEIFLNDQGVVAFPFYIDPLVMYWNRDIFANESLVSPPSTWNQVSNLTPVLTFKDQNFNVTRSAISLGEFDNIKNAKEIILALLLQVENPVIVRDRESFTSTLIPNSPAFQQSTISAMEFFTEFSNPSNDLKYTWNLGLSGSEELFLAGDLAMYLGFSSEKKLIELQNPNLNFDLAILPQLENANTKRTFAKIGGLAVVRGSSKFDDAFKTIYELTSRDVMEKWSEITDLPSVRRDLVQTQVFEGSSDPVFAQSAVISKGFIDPDIKITNGVFSDMIREITSGSATIIDALTNANAKLKQII